jgi:hypothetical protein
MPLVASNTDTACIVFNDFMDEWQKQVDLDDGLQSASINAFNILQSAGICTDTCKKFSGAGGRHSGQIGSAVHCRIDGMLVGRDDGLPGASKCDREDA